MPARNDKAAVAKAAKAVDRDLVTELLRRNLAAKVTTRVRRERASRPPVSPPMPVSPPTSSGGIAGSPVTGGRRRRTASRMDFATKQKKVTINFGGRWPRMGTKRYAKAQVVREKIKLLNENDVSGNVPCRVKHLLGLPYDSGDAGKPGTITFHDLEVLVDKGLINIWEGEVK